MLEEDVGGLAVEVEPSQCYYIWLPSDKWEQRGSVTEWRMTWKCMGGVEDVEFNFTLREKLHPLAFTDDSFGIH